MTLQLIAEHMQDQLSKRGEPVRYQLERGLRLTLWRDGADTILSLVRAGVAPSAAEIKACRVAFTLPDDTAQETGRRNEWHIIRLRWRMQPTQAQLFQPPAAAAPTQYQGDL